ncbi:hypothetical protein NMG60_11036691 [Bertholletia excelsa]
MKKKVEREPDREDLRWGKKHRSEIGEFSSRGKDITNAVIMNQLHSHRRTCRHRSSTHRCCHSGRRPLVKPKLDQSGCDVGLVQIRFVVIQIADSVLILDW